MSSKTLEHTGSFDAVSADGETYTLEIWTTIIRGNTSDGPYRTEGLKELRTSDGRHVNRIAKGEYEVIGIESVRLTSSSPNAV